MNFRRVLFAAVVAATFATAEYSSAAMVTLNAVQDSTIRERPSSQGTVNQNGLGLSTHQGGSNATTGDRANAIFQFDLSGLGSATIVGAHVEYYDAGAGPDQASPFFNDTYLVYPDSPSKTPAELTYAGDGGNAFDQYGMHQQYITQSSYAVATGDGATEHWTEAPAASLDLTLDPNNALDVYHAGGSADAGVLAMLNAAKDDFGYVMVLSYRKSAGGLRTFGDIESGFAPRLVLETIPAPIPEPSTYALLGLGCIGFLALRRRAA